MHLSTSIYIYIYACVSSPSHIHVHISTYIYIYFFLFGSIPPTHTSNTPHKHPLQHQNPKRQQDDFKSDKAWLHLGSIYEAMALCYHRLAEAQQPLFASQPAMAAATEAKYVCVCVCIYLVVVADLIGVDTGVCGRMIDSILYILVCVCVFCFCFCFIFKQVPPRHGGGRGGGGQGEPEI